MHLCVLYRPSATSYSLTLAILLAIAGTAGISLARFATKQNGWHTSYHFVLNHKKQQCSCQQHCALAVL